MGLELCCWQGIGQSQSANVHQRVGKTTKFFARACLNSILHLPLFQIPKSVCSRAEVQMCPFSQQDDCSRESGIYWVWLLSGWSCDCHMTPMWQEKGGGAGRQFRMWIDESLSFFFRRLTFSPDGNLLVVPGPFVVVVVYATVYCYCLLMHVLDSKIDQTLCLCWYFMR